MFLAMGFTGKEAAKWKEAYINAFNAMAEQLAKQQQPSASTALTISLPSASLSAGKIDRWMVTQHSDSVNIWRVSNDLTPVIDDLTRAGYTVIKKDATPPLPSAKVIASTLEAMIEATAQRLIAAQRPATPRRALPTPSAKEKVLEYIRRFGSEGVVKSNLYKFCHAFKRTDTQQREDILNDLLQSGLITIETNPRNQRGLIIKTCQA